MEPTENLRQAIQEYKSENSQAFDVLYQESSKYIYTCIFKVMSGNDNAQDAINDIMQDTYAEISKYISQLEDEAKFLSWAGTIATRKCYAYLKKSNKYMLLNEEEATFDNLADNDNIIPEEVMQDKEKQRLLREIINTRLTEMQKLCIIAYYYNEQKQSEIAKELGIPENTVKTNLSRAKAKIKEGVLDLEKNKGTKLYSVAPVMLLLFREEVLTAVVPKEITKNVLSFTSASVTAGTSAAGTSAMGTTPAITTTTGVKGIIGKVAAASLKAKIIGAFVGLGVIGAIGGAVYMANKTKEAPSLEREYKEEHSNDDTKDEKSQQDIDEKKEKDEKNRQNADKKKEREIVEETELAYYYMPYAEFLKELKKELNEKENSDIVVGVLGYPKEGRKIKINESIEIYNVDKENADYIEKESSGYTKKGIIMYAVFGKKYTYMVSTKGTEVFFVKTEKVKKVMTDLGEVIDIYGSIRKE